MKSLSASSFHQNLQRNTEKKAPHRNVEESTERRARRIEQLKNKLQQRKRGVPNEEASAKADIRAAVAQAKHFMEELENELVKRAGTASLKFLEQIDKQISDRYPDEEDIEKLVHYRIQLNAEEGELKEQVMGLLEVLPVPGQQPLSSRMNRRKYQEIIDRMQIKLEKCLINEQKLIEQRKQFEKRIERAPKEPKQSVLNERYQRQNQILVQQNLKLVNRSLEMVSQNSVLKQKLRTAEQQLESLSSQLRGASSAVGKLEVKLNKPDRQLLEENKNLQLNIEQLKTTNSTLQERTTSLQSKLTQITSRIYSSSAEIDCSQRQVEQLKQQLESVLYKSTEDENKYLHIQNLFTVLQQEKQELSKSLSAQLKEISDIRKSQAYHVLENQRLLDEIGQLKQQIDEAVQKKTRLEKSMERALEDSKDQQMQLIREAQNRESLQRDKQLLGERLANIEGLLESVRRQKSDLMDECHKHQQSAINLRTENLQLISKSKVRELELERLQHQIEQIRLDVTVKANKIQSTKKKQQQSKKHLQQKAELEQSYACKFQALFKDVSIARVQIQGIRQSYETRRRLHQTRLKIIKQRFSQDVITVLEKSKSKKQDNLQTAERLIDSFSNLSHKESIITRLKEEKGQLSRELLDLKSKLVARFDDTKSKKLDPKLSSSIKPRADKKMQETDSEIREFSNELIAERAKIQKSNAEERLKVADQTISSMESYIRKIEQQRDQFEKLQIELATKVKQFERRGKVEKVEEQTRSNNHILQVQNQELKNDIGLIRTQLQDIRRDRDDLRQDVKHKKDYLNTIKKDIKDYEAKLKALNLQLQQQKEEHSKTKKMLKQLQRKQQVIKDNRDKIESYRTLERQNAQLKRIIQERTKQAKLDLAKRDNTIKLLKQKEICSQSIMRESQNDVNNTQMLEQQLNSQIRKAKSEIDRKDILIKTLKQKLERAEDIIEKDKRQMDKKGQKDKLDLDRETRKVQQLKLHLKKLESQVFSFRTLLKKLGKLLLEQQKIPEKSLTPFKANELSMYEEGLSILQIKADDLKHFLPSSQNQNKNTINHRQLSELQRVLASDQLDASAAFTILADLVQTSCSRSH